MFTTKLENVFFWLAGCWVRYGSCRDREVVRGPGPVVETELLAPLVQISSGSQVDVMDTALVISAYQS